MLTYEDLLQEAKRDPRILGVVLSGSRGRGAGRPDSDWDAYLIVADDAAGALDKELGGGIDALLDLSILTLSEFESYAAPGSEQAWDAYALVHATIAHDRLGGRIGEIAAAKEMLSPGLANTTARQALDAFINAAVRAAKDRRDGEDVSATSTKRTPSVPRSKPYSPWSVGSARTTAT